MITAAILISTILSIGGPVVDTVVSHYKHKQNLTIDEARSLISNALNRVYSRSQERGEILSNKLMSLSIIQKTPALYDAVDQAYNSALHEKAKLQDEVSKAEVVAAKADNALNNADSATIFTRSKEIKNATQEVNNALQTLQQVEQKL